MLGVNLLVFTFLLGEISAAHLRSFENNHFIDQLEQSPSPPNLQSLFYNVHEDDSKTELAKGKNIDFVPLSKSTNTNVEKPPSTENYYYQKGDTIDRKPLIEVKGIETEENPETIDEEDVVFNVLFSKLFDLISNPFLNDEPKQMEPGKIDNEESTFWFISSAQPEDIAGPNQKTENETNGMFSFFPSLLASFFGDGNPKMEPVQKKEESFIWFVPETQPKDSIVNSKPEFKVDSNPQAKTDSDFVSFFPDLIFLLSQPEAEEATRFESTESAPICAPEKKSPLTEVYQLPEQKQIIDINIVVSPERPMRPFRNRQMMKNRKLQQKKWRKMQRKQELRAQKRQQQMLMQDLRPFDPYRPKLSQRKKFQKLQPIDQQSSLTFYDVDRRMPSQSIFDHMYAVNQQQFPGMKPESLFVIDTDSRMPSASIFDHMYARNSNGRHAKKSSNMPDLLIPFNLDQEDMSFEFVDDFLPTASRARNAAPKREPSIFDFFQVPSKSFYKSQPEPEISFIDLSASSHPQDYRNTNYLGSSSTFDFLSLPAPRRIESKPRHNERETMQFIPIGGAAGGPRNYLPFF